MTIKCIAITLSRQQYRRVILSVPHCAGGIATGGMGAGAVAIVCVNNPLKDKDIKCAFIIAHEGVFNRDHIIAYEDLLGHDYITGMLDYDTKIIDGILSN